MRALRHTIFLTLAMSMLTGAAFAQESFIIGVAPHTSARVILEMYQPLRLYLEQALKMPVEVVTAPDFNEFARRALAQEYDLAVTTGHQARLLQTDARFLPQLTYQADFKSVVIVAAKGNIRKPKDLKGTSVLGLSPASLVTLWGQHWLADNGLGSLPVKYVSASDSVAQLVVAGEAAAGFNSLANFQKLKPEVQSQLRILAESRSMTGRVYVLNSRWAAREKQINAALWAFAATAQGKHYFEVNKLDGYRRLRPNELQAMDKYASEVRKALRKGNK